MNAETRNQLFEQATKWVLEAGKHIRSKINDPLTIETKSNANDLVTTMDRETEKYFVAKIHQTYPNHRILSEEGYGNDLSSLDGVVWIIDPIDGTMNFVEQKRNFAISIGIYCDGIGEIGLIYDVMSDILYSAKRNEGAYKGDTKLQMLQPDLHLEKAVLGINHYWLCENRLVDEQVMQKLVKQVRGTRTYGSAALEMAYVAEGILDGYLAMTLSPWDVAAGMVILQEVGGIVTNIDGHPLSLVTNDSVIACHPGIQQRLLNDFLQVAKKGDAYM